MNNDNKNKVDCQSVVFSVYVIWGVPMNKFYVGVTYQDVYKRIRQHKRGKKQFIDKEINRIGWEGNWDWWTVEEHILGENIDEREKYWVDFFDCVYPKGYNKTHGGIGHIEVSEDTREKQRKNALARDYSGERNPNYGRKHTEEAKAIISAKLKGANSPNYGKPPANKGVPWTDEQKAAHSERMKGEKNPFFGKHHTDEAKEKNRQAHIGKPGRKGIPCSENAKKLLREKALARDVSGERNPFFGKHHTPETIEKNRQAHIGQPAWNKGKHPNDETRAKMSASAKARCARQKAEKEKANQENADNQENLNAQDNSDVQENIDVKDESSNNQNSNSDNQDKTS